MIGTLLYDSAAERFIVEALNDDGLIPNQAETVDLHCGNCLKVQVKADVWVDTRIEMNSDDSVYGWYFVGVGRCASLIGHSVRL